jgi:hypothetical protein
LPLSNSSVIATARASFKPKLPFNYLGMKKMMREHLTSVDRLNLVTTRNRRLHVVLFTSEADFRTGVLFSTSR